MLEACKTAWRDAPREQIARDLLNHKGQRFRLGCLLGSWLAIEQEAEADDWGEQVASNAGEAELDSATAPTAEGRAEMQQNLEDHVERRTTKLLQQSLGSGPEVHTALHSFAMERLVEQHLDEWGEAFAYAGGGSTSKRAQALREIYGEAAPVPGVEFSEAASEFLAGMRKLVALRVNVG